MTSHSFESCHACLQSLVKLLGIVLQYNAATLITSYSIHKRLLHTGGLVFIQLRENILAASCFFSQSRIIQPLQRVYALRELPELKNPFFVSSTRHLHATRAPAIGGAAAAAGSAGAAEAAGAAGSAGGAAGAAAGGAPPPPPPAPCAGAGTKAAFARGI